MNLIETTGKKGSPDNPELQEYCTGGSIPEGLNYKHRMFPFDNKMEPLKVISVIDSGDKVALSGGEGEPRQVVSARGGL